MRTLVVALDDGSKNVVSDRLNSANTLSSRSA